MSPVMNAETTYTASILEDRVGEIVIWADELDA